MTFNLHTISNKIVKAFKEENNVTQPENGDVYKVYIEYKKTSLEIELTVNVDGGLGYDRHDGVSWSQTGSTPIYNYDCNCWAFDKQGKPFDVPQNVKEKIKETLIYQLS